MEPTARGLHQFEVLFLHPAGSDDPQRVSLAIGLLEWVRLWFESRNVRATLWPETAVDPQGHRRFIMRPAAWGPPEIRRKLELTPTAEGVIYLNLDSGPGPAIANLALEDRRGERLAQMAIPLSPDGIYENVPGAIQGLLKALDHAFPPQTSAELFHTEDRGTALASLYAIERTVAFGVGVGGDDPQRLLEPILQCLQRDPSHPIARECLTRMAAAMIETGRADNQSAALSALERWCAFAPLAAAPSFHLALARQRLGRAEEARAAYEDALRRDPTYLPALQGYADWLASRGFIDQGLAVLLQAFGRTSFTGNLFDQAGCLLANAGRLGEAEPYFRQAIEAGGPSTAHTNLARALLGRNREEETLDALTKGLAAGIDSSLLELLAELSRRPGLVAARARAVLRGRIAEGSADPGILRTLIELSLELDGPDAAAVQARRLIELVPFGESRRYAHAVILQAKIRDFEKRWDTAVGQVAEKDPAEAAAFFQEVVGIEPEFGRAHFLLGVALERLGRMREATPHLEQALLREGDDPAVLDLLARARGDAGDLPGAAQVHYRAAALAPKDPRILRNAAVSLVRAGFIEEGIGLAGISLAIRPDQPDLIALVRQLATAGKKDARANLAERLSGILKRKKR